MKKIVILSERLPFPPTSGTKNLLFNYCRILHNDLGMDVVNISFLEQDEDVSQKPPFISKVYVLPNPSGKQKLKNIIFRTLIKKEFPLQVSLFWDPAIKKQVDSIISREDPDYVIADFIRTTEYLKDFSGYKIADLQDLLSLRYERQLGINLDTFNPYGAYLYRFPGIIQRVIQSRIIKKIILRTEIKLLKKFESNVGKQYIRVMFVAKKECELFDKMIGCKKSLTVPLGVDYDYFSKQLHVKNIPNSIAFMGALNVAHNENGISHFITCIFPLILREIPDAKLFVIGGGATETIKSFEAENIVFTGKVPDVREAIEACKVFICPLQFGSGIKTKNLEAMAMGIPVVTTGVGAENIDAEDGVDWFVADSDTDFADKVIMVLKDDNVANTIGCSGQRFIENHFTWARAKEAFESVLTNKGLK